jgi:hypothetical protein
MVGGECRAAVLKPVVVKSDRSAAWRFGRLFSGIMFFATPLGIGFAYVEDGASSNILRGVFLGIVPVSLLAGYGYAWYASRRFGDVAYEVAEGFLRVRQREEIVRQIRLKDICYFKMRNIVDRKSLIIRLYPPMWPRGVVTFQGSKGLTTVELTPILLWGEEAFSEADARIRSAIFDRSGE